MAKRDSHFPIDFRRLPAGWAHAAVGDLAVSVRPGFASGKHTNDPVGIPHLRPMNISREGRLDLSVLRFVPEGSSDLRVRAGEVLFNNTNSRELVGKTAPINNNEYGFSNHMTRLRLPPSLDHRYVAYQLHYLWMSGYFRYLATQHVNQASISAGTLRDSVQLAIAPPPEQAKIANQIDHEIGRLDATVAALRRVQATAAEYRVLLVDLASRGRLLPPLEPVRGKEVEEAGEELLRRISREQKQQGTQASLFDTESERPSSQPRPPGPLPKGWATAILAELSSDRSYGTSVKSDYRAEGPPVLRIPNVVNGTIDLTDLKRARRAEGLKEEKQLRPGDFLIIRTNGSRSLIGKAAVVTKPFSTPHFFASYLIRFRLLGSRTLWDWVSMVWGSSATRAAIESVAWTTAGQYNVNLRNLGAIQLPIPPEREQQRILQEVHAQWDVLDRLNVIITQNLARAADLRLTIMDRAFKGKLVSVRRPKARVDVLTKIREEVAALRQEEARLQREENVAKRQAKSAGPSTDPLSPNILQFLKRNKSALPAETVFEKSGFSFEERDDVDAFYEQLSAAVRAKRASVAKRASDVSYIKALP